MIVPCRPTHIHRRDPLRRRPACPALIRRTRARPRRPLRHRCCHLRRLRRRTRRCRCAHPRRRRRRRLARLPRYVHRINRLSLPPHRRRHPHRHQRRHVCTPHDLSTVVAWPDAVPSIHRSTFLPDLSQSRLSGTEELPPRGSRYARPNHSEKAQPGLN